MRLRCRAPVIGCSAPRSRPLRRRASCDAAETAAVRRLIFRGRRSRVCLREAIGLLDPDLRIGALATLSSLECSRLVARHAPVIIQTLRTLSDVRVRKALAKPRRVREVVSKIL